MTDFLVVENILQNISSPGIKPGLERIERLFALLGNCERQIRAVHVVGTNGKGSTAATLEAVLRASGYKTALYTSPHLASFGERLTINGKMLSADKWLCAIETMQNVLKSSNTHAEDMPTYFELTTAAAFCMIAESNVDIAVVEAGLGGRLDATNTLSDILVTLITPIGMDHTDYLGETLEKIAAEKFAVIRKNVPAIFAGGDTSLELQFKRCCENADANGMLLSETGGVKFIKTDINGTQFIYNGHEYQTALAGAYQADNTALALAAVNILKENYDKITDETVELALSKISWQGRMEVVRKNPMLILDGAHNSHAMKRLAENITLFFGRQTLNVVIAMMKDKDIEKSLSLLKGFNLDFFCTEVPEMQRSLKADEMAETATSLGFTVRGSFASPYGAVKEASKQGCPVLCFGSLYMLAWLKENYPEEFLK